MKQNTVMRELMDYINSNQHFSSFAYYEKARELLKKEEEQIKQAYNQGYREGQDDIPLPNTKDVSQFSNAQFYFTETYNNQ